MSTKYFDLRPDKHLIDEDFEKYQLSLDKNKCDYIKLPLGVLAPKQSEKPNSFEKVVVSQWFNNLLFFNTFNQKIYWVNSENGVNCNNKDNILFSLPKNEINTEAKFIPSIKFISDTNVIAADGHGFVYIIKTDKQNHEKWKVLKIHETFNHQYPNLKYARKNLASCQASTLMDAQCFDSKLSTYEFDHGVIIEILSFCLEERVNIKHHNQEDNKHKRLHSELDSVLGGKEAIKFVKTSTLSTLEQNPQSNNGAAEEHHQPTLEEEIKTTQEHLKEHLRGEAESSHHVCLLEWVTYHLDEKSGTITQLRKRILEGFAHPSFACIERGNSNAVHILSDMPYKFIYDSSLPEKHIESNEHCFKQFSNKATDKPIYYWSQEDRNLKLKVLLPEGVNSSDIEATFNPDSIKFMLKPKGATDLTTLLEGTFAQSRKIVVEKSTWGLVNDTANTFEPKGINEAIIGNYIEIVMLSHTDNKGHWPNPPLKNSPYFGQMDPDYCRKLLNDIDSAVAQGETADEQRNLLKDTQESCVNVKKSGYGECTTLPDSEDNGPLIQPYNLQELEECDSYPEDTCIIGRYDGNTHCISHQASLSNNKFLFTCPPIKAGDAPIFVIRHDVHATFWQPQSYDSAGSDYSPWRNVMAFEALGYVIASKENRKMIGASLTAKIPYVVIADYSNHLFLYYKQGLNKDSLDNGQGERVHQGNVLKNRKTGKTFGNLAGHHKLGVQKLITIENADSDKAHISDISQVILGLACLKDHIYVLGADQLCCIDI